MTREYECWSCGLRRQERARFCEECGRPPLDAPDSSSRPAFPRIVHPTAVRAYCAECGGWLKRAEPSKSRSRSARKRKIYRSLGLEGSRAKNGNITAGQRGSETGSWTHTPGNRERRSEALSAALSGEAH